VGGDGARTGIEGRPCIGKIFHALGFPVHSALLPSGVMCGARLGAGVTSLEYRLIQSLDALRIGVDLKLNGNLTKRLSSFQEQRSICRSRFGWPGFVLFEPSVEARKAIVLTTHRADPR
jgi:hypothetical protein